MRFNVRKMIADCGGAAACAEAISVARTTPYRWMKQGSLSSRTLECIKVAFPLLCIDNYFSETDDERNETGDTGSSRT